MRRINTRRFRASLSVRSSAGENSYYDADQCCDTDHLPRVVAHVDVGVLAGLTRLRTNLRGTVGESALGRCKCDFDLRLDARDFRRLHIPQCVSQILDVLDEAVDLTVGEFFCAADVAAIYRGFHLKFLLTFAPKH